MISYNYRIESYDVQPNGCIKMSALMRIMQKIAGDDLDGSNLSYMNLYKYNIAFVLTKITIRTHKEIKLYDNVIVETYPRPVKGASFVRDFIIRLNDEIAVLASSTWCIIDLAERKILRPSALDSIGVIPDTTENSFSLPFIRRIVKIQNTNQTDVRRTLYSQLDMNCHLNNTFYADYVFDCIPEPHKLPMNDMFFEINFKNEARLGEDLIICSTDMTSHEIDFIAVKKSDSKPCFTAYLNLNAEKM